MATHQITLTPTTTTRDLPGGPAQYPALTVTGAKNIHGTVTITHETHDDPAIRAEVHVTATLNRIPLSITEKFTLTRDQDGTITATPDTPGYQKVRYPSVRRTDGSWGKSYGFDTDVSDSTRSKAEALMDEVATALTGSGADFEDMAERTFRARVYMPLHLLTSDVSRAIQKVAEGVREALTVKNVKDPSVPLVVAAPSEEEVRARTAAVVGAVLDIAPTREEDGRYQDFSMGYLDVREGVRSADVEERLQRALFGDL